MAPWGDAKLFFCILFITCCCTMTLAQMPSDCCLQVKNKAVDKMAVVDYVQQIQGQGCHLDAMVLLTRRGKRLCVPVDEMWLRDVMKHVDSLKKHCRQHNYKGKRCIGVRHQ